MIVPSGQVQDLKFGDNNGIYDRNGLPCGIANYEEQAIATTDWGTDFVSEEKAAHVDGRLFRWEPCLWRDKMRSLPIKTRAPHRVFWKANK